MLNSFIPLDMDMAGSDDGCSDAIDMAFNEAKHSALLYYRGLGAAILEALLVSNIKLEEYRAICSLLQYASPDTSDNIIAHVHSRFTGSSRPFSVEDCDELLAKLNARHPNVDGSCLRMYVAAAHRLHLAAEFRLSQDRSEAAMRDGFQLFGTEVAQGLQALALGSP